MLELNGKNNDIYFSEDSQFDLLHNDDATLTTFTYDDTFTSDLANLTFTQDYTLDKFRGLALKVSPLIKPSYSYQSRIWVTLKMISNEEII